MTKESLVNAIAAAANITKTAANTALNTLTAEIASAVNLGDTVKLPGFGTFSRVARKEKDGRNPKTGAALKIPASFNMKLKPSSKVKQNLNASN